MSPSPPVPHPPSPPPLCPPPLIPQWCPVAPAVPQCWIRRAEKAPGWLWARPAGGGGPFPRPGSCEVGNRKCRRDSIPALSFARAEPRAQWPCWLWRCSVSHPWAPGAGLGQGGASEAPLGKDVEMGRLQRNVVAQRATQIKNQAGAGWKPGTAHKGPCLPADQPAASPSAVGIVKEKWAGCPSRLLQGD